MRSIGGITFLLKLLGGIHKYADYIKNDLTSGEHYLPQHPFRQDFPGTTVLIGSPGITASIAGFTYHLARRIGEGLKLVGLTRYRVPSATDSQASNLFYEAVLVPDPGRPEWGGSTPRRGLHGLLGRGRRRHAGNGKLLRPPVGRLRGSY